MLNVLRERVPLVLSEDVVYELVQYMYIQDIINYSLTDTTHFNICEHEYVWKRKIHQDFPTLGKVPLPGLSMKESYIELYRSKKNLPVYVNNELYTHLLSTPYFNMNKYIEELVPKINSNKYVIMVCRNRNLCGVYVYEDGLIRD